MKDKELRQEVKELKETVEELIKILEVDCEYQGLGIPSRVYSKTLERLTDYLGIKLQTKCTEKLPKYVKIKKAKKGKK